MVILGSVSIAANQAKSLIMVVGRYISREQKLTLHVAGESVFVGEAVV